MRKIIEETYCDICEKKKPVVKIDYPVVFHTDQTEGYSVEPYISQQKLEVCNECFKKIAFMHGEGAMGYNKYQIKPTTQDFAKENA